MSYSVFFIALAFLIFKEVQKKEGYMFHKRLKKGKSTLEALEWKFDSFVHCHDFKTVGKTELQ